MAKIPVQQEVPALVKSFTKNGVTYNAVRQGKIVTITGAGVATNAVAAYSTLFNITEFPDNIFKSGDTLMNSAALVTSDTASPYARIYASGSNIGTAHAISAGQGVIFTLTTALN